MSFIPLLVNAILGASGPSSDVKPPANSQSCSCLQNISYYTRGLKDLGCRRDIAGPLTE